MLIGLYGPSRAGKDTVAGVLVKNHGFEQRNLASPIRETLLKINPPVSWDEGWGSGPYSLEEALLDSENGWDSVKADFPHTVDWMIQLGQSMRDIDPDIWLNACITNYDSSTDLVIADVRQPNEYEYIWDNGGEVWWIVSDRENVQSRGMDGLLDDKYFPVKINNNGTINELEGMVATIMEARK